MEQSLNAGKKQFDRAINSAGDVIRSASSILQDQSLVEQATEVYHSAETVVRDVASKSTDMARRYPLRSLAGAVACGFLLATLFRSRD